MYVLFTALVLISLLIAMATNRYELAKRHAEYTWRFNAVYFGLFIERLLALLVRCTGRRRPALGRLARSYRDPQHDGRYLLDVRQKTTRARVDSERRRSPLDNTQLTDIAHRLDLLTRLH